MLMHEKLQRDGINKLDQIFAYYKAQGIEPFFWARHAKILLREAAADTDRVDIVIYVLDLSTKISSTKTNVKHIKADEVIVVVNIS